METTFAFQKWKEVQPSSICEVHTSVTFNEFSLAVHFKPLYP